MRAKVKVGTGDLLAVLRKRREQAVAAHEREKARYEDKIGHYQARVVAALRNAAEDASKGKLPNRNYRTEVSVKVPGGSPPNKPSLDTRRIDQEIRLLELSCDDVIALSPEDAAYYLG